MLFGKSGSAGQQSDFTCSLKGWPNFISPFHSREAPAHSPHIGDHLTIGRNGRQHQAILQLLAAVLWIQPTLLRIGCDVTQPVRRNNRLHFGVSGCRQQVPLKRRKICTRLHGVTPQQLFEQQAVNKLSVAHVSALSQISGRIDIHVQYDTV